MQEITAPSDTSQDVEFNNVEATEEMTLDTAQFAPVTDELLKAYVNKLGDDTLKNISDDSVSIQQQETAAYLVSESNTSDYDNTEDDEEVQEKKLSGEACKDNSESTEKCRDLRASLLSCLSRLTVK